MDFKIKISCYKCKCNFELRPNESARSEIFCPNCSSKVPEEIASHILSGLHELGAVPESYTEDKDTLLPETGFAFKVKSYSFPEMTD